MRVGVRSKVRERRWRADVCREGSNRLSGDFEEESVCECLDR